MVVFRLRSQVSGGPATLRTDGAGGIAASLIPGCQTAEPMSPMSAMTNPPLTAVAAKARIKALQAAAFVAAKRLSSPAFHYPHRPPAVAAAVVPAAGPVAGSAGGANGAPEGCVIVSVGSDDDRAHNPLFAADDEAAPTTAAALAYASAKAAAAAAAAPVANGPAASAAGGAAASPAGTAVASTAASSTPKAKRPLPGVEVVVLDISGDEEKEGEKNGAGVTSESPAKKIKTAQPQQQQTAPVAATATAIPSGTPTGTPTAAATAVAAAGVGAVTPEVGAKPSVEEPKVPLPAGGEVSSPRDAGSSSSSPPAAAAAATAAAMKGTEVAVSDQNGGSSSACSAAAAAYAAKKATPAKKKGGTLDSFWNSP